MSKMEWCDERKGLRETIAAFSGSLPANEWIFVVFKASCSDKGIEQFRSLQLYNEEKLFAEAVVIFLTSLNNS